MSDWNDARRNAIECGLLAALGHVKVDYNKITSVAERMAPFIEEHLDRLKRPSVSGGGEWNYDISAAPMLTEILCFVEANRIPFQEEPDRQYIAFQKRPGIFGLQEDDHILIEPKCWRPLPPYPAALKPPVGE